MENKFVLEGKVLSSWKSRTNIPVIKLAVVHEHHIGQEIDVKESIFQIGRVNPNDTAVILPGDKVRVSGYLNMRLSVSSGGKPHQTLYLSATDIEILP